jgi:hypothetical protein
MVVMMALGGGCYVEDGQGNQVAVVPTLSVSTGANLGEVQSGFTMTWRLVDARLTPSNPQLAEALSCGQAGVASVHLELSNQDTGMRYAYDFACNAGGGGTDPVPAGHYVVSVEARDAAGRVQSENTWSTDNLVRTDLGSVVFLVNP